MNYSDWRINIAERPVGCWTTCAKCGTWYDLGTMTHTCEREPYNISNWYYTQGRLPLRDFCYGYNIPGNFDFCSICNAWVKMDGHKCQKDWKFCPYCGIELEKHQCAKK